MKPTVETLNDYITRQLKPLMKRNKSLKEVIVWVKNFNEKRGLVHLGMALGNSAGCSPFCGCAARQVAEVIGEELKKEFPDVLQAVGVAEIPPEEIVTGWK